MLKQWEAKTQEEREKVTRKEEEAEKRELLVFIEKFLFVSQGAEITQSKMLEISQWPVS